MSEEDNVIKVGGRTMIFNGGNALPGCPDSWGEACAWEDKANEGKNKIEHPIWNFDSGFKLDFDGPLISVSSRFYPPKTHYGLKWDGRVIISILGRSKIREKFECDSLDELKKKVESFVYDFVEKLMEKI